MLVEKVVFHFANGSSFSIPIGVAVSREAIDKAVAQIRNMWLDEEPPPTAEIVPGKEV